MAMLAHGAGNFCRRCLNCSLLRSGDGLVDDLGYLPTRRVAAWPEVQAGARLSRSPAIVTRDDAMRVRRLHVPEEWRAYRHVPEGGAGRVEHRPACRQHHYLAQLPPRHTV